MSLWREIKVVIAAFQVGTPVLIHMPDVTLIVVPTRSLVAPRRDHRASIARLAACCRISIRIFKIIKTKIIPMKEGKRARIYKWCGKQREER